MVPPAWGAQPGSTGIEQPVQFGKYVLLDRISIGGMAEVFKAKLKGVDGFEKVLAIKRILPALVKDKEFIEMFVDEAKIAGQLTQENICPIYELGKVGESYYIAMEHVWGKDLLQVINRFRRLQKFMPPPMVAWLASKICAALDYAHSKTDADGNPLNIIHRDISPQNIIVSYEGQVKLIDFGIAKAASRNTRTRAGILKGKFGYMSPEQVRGMELDPRSDIFTVGTCMWEMALCGRLFRGESDFSTLEKVRRAKVVKPSQQIPTFPQELENIIMRALEREPQDRFQSASEMLGHLQMFLQRQNPPYGTSTLASWMKTVFTQEVVIERHRLDKLMSEEWKQDSRLQPPSSSTRTTSAGAVGSATHKEAIHYGTVKLDSSEIKIDGLDDDTAPEGEIFERKEDASSPIAEQATFVFFSSDPNSQSQAPAESTGATLPPPLPSKSSERTEESLTKGVFSTPEGDTNTFSENEGSWRQVIKPKQEPNTSWRIPEADASMDRSKLIVPTSSTRRRRSVSPMILWIACCVVLSGGLGWGAYAWKFAPRYGALNIQTLPNVSASVLIDGEFKGRSPIALQMLKIGHHTLELKAQGFKPVRRRIQVKKDWVSELEIALTPVSKVANSSAKVSGQPITTPDPSIRSETSNSISQDEQTSQKNSDNFDPEDTDVGYLAIRSVPSARIFIDGVDSGKSTPQRRMRLSPGMHRIELKANQGKTRSLGVLIRRGERTRIREAF